MSRLEPSGSKLIAFQVFDIFGTQEILKNELDEINNAFAEFFRSQFKAEVLEDGVF